MPGLEVLVTAAARDASALVVVLLLLGACLVVGGLAYAAFHWLGYDPAWARSSRHAVGEAGWRVSATWAEFTDWLRLGR